MTELNLPYAHMYFEHPIVYIEFGEDVELGFIEVRELIACAEKLSGGNPYVVLSDIRKGVSLTPMGRKTASRAEEAPLHRGSAVLVKNEMLRAAANFFSKLSAKPFPFQAFTRRHRAIRWLCTISLEKAG